MEVSEFSDQKKIWAGRYYNDTGFCNRLLYWECVQIINKLHKDRFDIIVHEEQWRKRYN